MRERLLWIESRAATPLAHAVPQKDLTMELEMNTTSKTFAPFLLFAAALLFFFVALRPVLVGAAIVPTFLVLALAFFAIGLAVARVSAKR